MGRLFKTDIISFNLLYCPVSKTISTPVPRLSMAKDIRVHCRKVVSRYMQEILCNKYYNIRGDLVLLFGHQTLKHKHVYVGSRFVLHFFTF